jgi:hypothetical protein
MFKFSSERETRNTPGLCSVPISQPTLELIKSLSPQVDTRFPILTVDLVQLSTSTSNVNLVDI